ncbi:cytochrome c biogenesis CcdA family protein [Corynebacterium sp. CCM 8835]|uniref:Cytochrome c biogenesis CcdA family protein n=1 Tax=Corynebacterium antarcticum TaxID=2800405 RepID=A0A9Q4GMQ2_9CORY|nr:cytochrome c biogenesis CcdA family protein [Corynebacterium antarcticum]MCK7642484.1 cytochrome c biogenesis CcdA family protein [Corynebacterium antarcticum]MCK7660831.1 cytochrome c biogenesis CcdA family protein [Corynebacterium antarcticum]MCL0245578.1 cytochrome c biogenesis CcdA family protein [Corynebacterium antarcticum]MCX7491966.1 cytochrome c biogenesis CcdA family protein [Corynebacterium antarcticum]MCX7537986.1 cytochrome c biogenesis CcdA family protein [Corynebacterium anta
MLSIGVVGAFLGGVLSILSPCSALLLPAFFAYAFTSKRQLMARTAVFFAGLASVLVPVGAGIGGFSSLFTQHRDTVISVAGWVMVAFGVWSLLGLGFRIPGLSTMNNRIRGTGWLPVFALGAVYGFAGFCAGPLLGAVLATSALGGSATYGALVMACYALGMTVPLFLLALLWDRFDLGHAGWLRGREIHVGPVHTNTLSIAAGVLFILIGFTFLMSNGTSALPTLLDTETQFRLQGRVAELAAGIDNTVALLIVLCIIAAGVGARLLRRR